MYRFDFMGDYTATKSKMVAGLGLVYTYPDIFENAYLFICFRKNLRPYDETFQKNLLPHGYGGITNKKFLFVKLTVQTKLVPSSFSKRYVFAVHTIT